MSLSDELKDICNAGAVAANPNIKIPTKLEQDLREINLKHSRNGDPESYYLEALILKLGTYHQDSTVMEMIEPEEILTLISEWQTARQPKEPIDDKF